MPASMRRRPFDAVFPGVEVVLTWRKFYFEGIFWNMWTP